MSLGNNIKKIRNERNLTQEELGDKVGVKSITIRKYESNDREPNLNTLEKIAEALDVPVTHLLYDDNEFVSYISELNKIINSPDEKRKIINTKDESQLTIPQKLFKSSYTELKNLEKEVVTGVNETKENIRNKLNSLIELGINENMINDMYPSELEELISFLETAAKIKYEELINKRKADATPKVPKDR